MKITQEMINQVISFVKEQNEKGSSDFTFVKLKENPEYVLHLNTYATYLYGFSLRKLNRSKTLLSEKVETLDYYEFPETIEIDAI